MTNDKQVAYSHYLFQVLGLTALYFIFGHISFLTTVSHYIVTPVFFVPEGIALAAAIVLGRRIWPGILLGQLALAMSTGLEFLPSLIISLINSMEALIGATLFRRWKLSLAINSVRDLNRLMLMIFLILQPFSATLGITTLLTFDVIQESQSHFQAWAYWWFGNCMGQFLITPFLLALCSRPHYLKNIQQSIRRAIIPIALMLPATWLIFGDLDLGGGGIALALVIYVPLLIWIAISSGLAVVSLICSGITLLALYETSRGLGPFVLNETPSIFDMNIFILGISLTAQFVSTLFAERDQIETALRDNEAKLYSIIDSSSIPKAVNDEHQNIIFLNKAFIQLFGYTLEDIPTLADWWPKAYPDRQYRQHVKTTWARNLKKALKEKSEFEPLDIIIRCKDGSQRSVIATASALDSPAFKKSHLVTFVDITLRKNLETQLIKSHQFLEDLSNNIPGFIYQYQLFPDGRSCVPFASKGMIKLMGISPEQVTTDASLLFSLVHPEDMAIFHTSIQESAKTLAEWHIEYRIIVAQKEIRWIHAQSKPEKQHDGSIIWNGYTTDITELKNASLRFEALLDSASDGIHILDEDGNVVHYSRSFAKMLGYSYEETARLNVMDWDAKIPKEKLINVAREILTTPRVFETLHRRKDGSIFDVEINARGIDISGKKFIYASSRDITVRKQRDKELEYQRLRLSNIIEGTNIGTWEWNIQTGIVIFNQRWAEIIGFTLDELAPVTIETWLKYAHPDDLEQSQALLEDHFSGKIPYYECSVRMLHKAGHWVWVFDRGKVLSWTKEGKPFMMFGTHQDITEIKEREAMLIEARQQAEAASIAKTRFLAMMSHEIRTPMNVVLGMAYLLSKTSLDSHQSTYLRNIAGSSHILLGVINDILDYSKIEANKIELDSIPFDLNTILENLAALASIAAKDKTIDVLFYVESDVPRHFIGDPLRLSQIFVNLTNNAIKFTGQGEVIIRIAIDNADTSGIAALTFSVIDSGIGITAKQMESLFQAFSQADTSITRRFGGTGLGLSISHRLAQQMNGDIKVESMHGKGSEFHCTVKLQRLSHQDDPWIVIPSALQSLRVLIIDDHAVTRTVIAETIQALGWSTIAVENSSQAIQHMTTPVSNATAIDLLLLTMRLPGTDYLGTIHAIEKHLPPHHPLKTILITNNFGPQFSKEIEHQITISILDRPFTPVDLFDAVATLFDISKIGQIDQKLIIEDAKRQFIGTHILVAEDNEFNQMLISELLSNWGITVSLASNGIECLDLLRQTEPSFNLIFMDIQMPEMDGLEATRRIRQDLHLSIPIIALTANIMIEDQQKYLRAGMDAYLPKPFDPDQLYQILHRFM